MNATNLIRDLICVLDTEYGVPIARPFVACSGDGPIRNRYRRADDARRNPASPKRWLIARARFTRSRRSMLPLSHDDPGWLVVELLVHPVGKLGTAAWRLLAAASNSALISL